MKPFRQHLIPALAALALAGGAAGTAAAADPDPQPFLTTDSSAALGTPKWYVDTSRTSGYSALYRHPVEVKNGAGAGALELTVTPGSATGTSPITAGARQVHPPAAPTDLAPGVTLATTAFLGGTDYRWGVRDLISYTLTPASGPAVPSAIAPTCWFDGTIYEFEGCKAEGTGDGFVSGIPAGGSDAIALDPNVTDPGTYPTKPSFNITSVAPGTGAVTATINAAVVDAVPGNNSTNVPLKVPGVASSPVAVSTTTTTPVAVQMSATIVLPEVLGRRFDAAGPPPPAPAEPASGPGALVYAIASGPSNGTVTGLNPATGAATYTANAGFTGQDTFTYHAEDSRGLRGTATVTVTVKAASTTPTTPATPTTPTRPATPTTPANPATPARPAGGPAGFTLSARQLLITQRIGQAAIRRLAAVEAKIEGRPAPTFPSAGKPGKVTLSAGQLLINQRIYQAGVRRAAVLEARLDNRPLPTFGKGSGDTVKLTLRQLIINQRIAQAAVRRANALLARVD